MNQARHIFSVSELNNAARLTLEEGLGRVWLEAELSNLARPASGHWYFSLKDKKSQIRCAFFKANNRLLKFAPLEGDLLLVRGRISLYEPRGDYQLIIDHMEPAGQGDLQRQYEETRLRLQAAGLFDDTHKQLLPAYPSRIGVITSPSGAAIRDVLHVLARRYPVAEVVIYPSSVQGEQAEPELTAALSNAIKRNECDVLILSRGGGSIEDLWPFNSEKLVAQIHQCPIPLVSGVGHETDFTLSDYVADIRAPTPSAAAELVVPDLVELESQLERYRLQLTRQIENTLQTTSQELDWVTKHMRQMHPGALLLNWQERLARISSTLQQTVLKDISIRRLELSRRHDNIKQNTPEKFISAQRDRVVLLASRLHDKARHRIEQLKYQLADHAHTLDAISPIATLSRGYSITYKHDSKTAIKHHKEAKAGELIKTQLSFGYIVSRVEAIDE